MPNRWSWAILFAAGFFEVCWAIALKYTEGFTRFVPSVFTLMTLSLSMYLLSRACQTLPIGTAYGVWVGIGALGTAVLGMLLLNEPISLLRIVFLILLLISIVGLKLTSPSA